MGVLCKVSSFWDGAIHKSQFEPVDPSLKPRLESWRYMDGGMMVSPHTIVSSMRRSECSRNVGTQSIAQSVASALAQGLPGLADATIWAS